MRFKNMAALNYRFRYPDRPGAHLARAALFLILLSLLHPIHLIRAEVTPTQFEFLNDLLELNRLDEVIQQGELLKSMNQENLKLRTILFKAYLERNLPIKAEEEIRFIESRVNNASTLYLRALQAFHSNDLASALGFLDRITEKRYPPPYLLYYRIRMAEEKIPEAGKYLEQYRGLAGEDNDWFFYYGQYILAHYGPRRGKDMMIKHIDRYARAFPASHWQMYLWADYYASQEQFDRALEYIDKALYLSSSRPDYLERKLYYLFRDQQFSALIKTIDQNKPADQEKFIRYQWIKAFVSFINLKKEDEFTLLSPRHLPQILSPLENIIKINPENEVIRYFAEEILLVNTSEDDLRRRAYGQYRFRKAQLHQSVGRYQEADLAYKRCLLLTPLEPRYREAYLEFLRLTKQYEKYKLEADNYLARFTNQQNQSYIPIRKKLAERALAETLAEKFHLSMTTPPPHLKALITYDLRPYRESWTQPYLEALSAWMIAEILESPILEVVLSRQNRLLTLLSEGDYDYHIEFSLKDINQILTLTPTVRDRGKNIVYQQPLSFYGKERYQSMAAKLQTLAYEIFPKVGEITAIEKRQAVITLGSAHGARVGDQVTLFKSGNSLGNFPLEIVDNFYSLITIDKIFALSQTEIGDRVVLVEER